MGCGGGRGWRGNSFCVFLGGWGEGTVNGRGKGRTESVEWGI